MTKPAGSLAGMSTMTKPSAGSLASRSTWVSTTSVSSSGKRIQREMVELNLDPPPGCCAGPKGDNLYNWVATIIGPPDNPLVPGIAHLYLQDEAKHAELAAEWTLRFAK
ncbi:hypothetical protein Pyn_10018 [Prunus yedoensis var. nudiflora]|uniref:UBC core domain-containing protein n=1 Tax=Prunus yedoensis var. nudiflora TaxID=2094558 RepID=A0A314XNQ2_PRUYE|nr:hypothetical protein Pyn_10018 [Prunus yedoensis var. nudiflora]